MTTYVLVPGFWLGAWAWDGVAAELRAAGHEVRALTPLGVAERATTAEVSAADQVADVVATIRREAEPVVLVGHSGAGPVVVAAAEEAREQVAGLVLVDTGPMPEGVAHIDFHPPEMQTWIRERIAAHGGWYPMPTPEELRTSGASLDGLDTDTLETLVRRAAPEPAGVVLGPVRRGVNDPSLPKILVASSFPGQQVRELAAAGVPAFAQLADPEWDIRDLPTGHWPMLSEPHELAVVLADVAPGRPLSRLREAPGSGV
ncbi:putative esterase [Pseudonocardia dioxanivorans CB1190]|uniref:Esterase n=1 Tax=Pseudonocardia dioxanivorans (strain ATCC 55486 / DSM 44775 / JCM 13855 / CB1190) TaxID=675635 RepID=F4CWL6_PSEUX|nr:alpha/beta hydrolase [Pseudonocardia dioxanivorans]AEA28708.1 putative esterase [Pseudonocardia dioxanivorans CB1190]